MVIFKMVSSKSIFSHTPKEHLKEQGVENPVLRPEPVITRWGTQLSAALYYNDYSDQLTTFVDAELHVVSSKPSPYQSYVPLYKILM